MYAQNYFGIAGLAWATDSLRTVSLFTQVKIIYRDQRLGLPRRMALKSLYEHVDSRCDRVTFLIEASDGGFEDPFGDSSHELGDHDDGLTINIEGWIEPCSRFGRAGPW